MKEVLEGSSFVRFVYPFLFDSRSFEGRLVRVASLKGEGQAGWQDISLPSDELLPHVAEYLNPPKDKPATACVWKLSDESLRSWCGYDAKWVLLARRRDEQIEIPFTFLEVHLSLFRVGVGFLCIDAKPKSDKLDDWLDFIHFFRFAGGERGVSLKGERVIPPEHAKEAKPFSFTGEFSERIAELLAPLRLSEEGDSTWWRDVFIRNQFLPFASLFVDGIPEQEIMSLIYRLRNFFHSRQEIHPSQDDLRADHPSLVPYAENMWFIFSLDGGAFLACNPPDTPFFRQTLPEHLSKHYFLLFLIALLQRFTLMRLSQDVAEHWLLGDEFERVSQFERIRDEFLEFTARGYFAQVMQREHHHRVYRKWQEIFQIERLYQEVKDEVVEMHEHLLSQQTKRLERRINFLGAFIGIPSLVIGFLGINLYGITAKDEGLPLWVALLLIALSFTLGGLAWWLLSRRS